VFAQQRHRITFSDPHVLQAATINITQEDTKTGRVDVDGEDCRQWVRRGHRHSGIAHPAADF
jgi:hypothetical protein